MSIARDWQDRHPRKSGKARVVFYILILGFILLLILKADTFVEGFTRIFFQPDSTAQESVGE